MTMTVFKKVYLKKVTTLCEFYSVGISYSVDLLVKICAYNIGIYYK